MASMQAAIPSAGKIAIVGSGLIGRQWAMIFAGAGHNVVLYDIIPEQVSGALKDIKEKLHHFESEGYLRGKLNADDQTALISGSSDLRDCVKDAVHIQECVPEILDLKMTVFGQLDDLVGDDTVLASSSSCLAASSFSENLQHRRNVLVAHPVNPPYFVPLVEMIPAPWTSPDVVVRTRALLDKVGQSPITMTKEMPGFAVNRIQYAILNECWHLIQSGAISPGDLDKVMTDGLGARYAFIGPLETMHLNADGIVDYCSRYAGGALKVSETFQPPPLYDVDTAKTLEASFDEHIPKEKIAERKKWRDERLALLSKLKRNADEK